MRENRSLHRKGEEGHIKTKADIGVMGFRRRAGTTQCWKKRVKEGLSPGTLREDIADTLTLLRVSKT